MRKTIGLPGTGLYYQENSSWPKSTEAAPPADSVAENSTGTGWIAIGLAIVIIVIAVNLGNGSKSTAVNTPKVEAQPTRPPATPPKPDRLLNQDEVRELQTLLRRQGFGTGMPDGIIGPKTQAAAQAFIKAHRLNAQGASSLRLLEAVRSYGK